MKVSAFGPVIFSACTNLNNKSKLNDDSVNVAKQCVTLACGGVIHFHLPEIFHDHWTAIFFIF